MTMTKSITTTKSMTHTKNKLRTYSTEENKDEIGPFEGSFEGEDMITHLK